MGRWLVNRNGFRPEVHSAQCEMMCAAVPCTRARDGPARHVPGVGRAASAIGEEGERALSERDRWSACYGMVCGCRFDTASSHTCTVHCTRAGILCTSGLEGVGDELIQILSRNWSGWSEKNHENPQSWHPMSSQDSKSVLQEYMSSVITRPACSVYGMWLREVW
jgi:hypothetical protein